MKHLKRVIGLTLATLVMSLPQAEAWQLTPVVGANLNNPSYGALPASLTGASRVGSMAGLLLGLGTTLGFSVELGALYLNQKYATESTLNSALQTTDTFHSFQFPLLARLGLADYFSVAVGPYYAVFTGDGDRNVGPADINSTVNYDTSGLKRSDFGLVGSVQGALPVGQLESIPLAAILDIRYVLGLTNNVDNAAAAGIDSRKTREFELLAGLRFDLQ